MKVTQYESFLRQLSIYGFRKLETDGLCAVQYIHENFTRDNESLQKRIRRRTSTNRGRTRPFTKQQSTFEVSLKDAMNDAVLLHTKCFELESVIDTARQQTSKRLKRFQESLGLSVAKSPAEQERTDVPEEWPFDDMCMYDYGNGCVSPTTVL